MNTYLFDFDGTLVDSMPYYVGVMKKILDDSGISYGSDLVKIITPLGFVGTAEYFVKMGVPLEKEEMIRKMHELAYRAYAYEVPAKENVEEVLKKLKNRGASLHVLTASPHETLDICLKRLGIFDLFDHVWSCEDFHTTKADPEIYKMAAEKIGKPVGEILFLDDNFNADWTAKAAGMKVCGVYDEMSREYETEIRAIADGYIRNFSELMNLRLKSDDNR